MNRIHQYVVAIAALLAMGGLATEATGQADGGIHRDASGIQRQSRHT